MTTRSNKFKYWTSLTAFCFARRFKCENCSERKFCDRREKNNEYGMKPIKYAAIKTYANIGLEGLKEALER